MTDKAMKAKEREDALDTLKRRFPQGSTVYTILRKVSRSGMQRHISVVALYVDDNGEASSLHPNYSAAILTGYRNVRRGLGYDGLILNGCGTDMGYEIAYALGQALYGDGYALKHRWL